MSSPTQNQRDQGASLAPEDQSGLQKDDFAENAQPVRPDVAVSIDQKPADIPRWRQIEIMRERAQLREELGDLDLEIDEIDEFEKEVFGTESENEILYRHDEQDADEGVDFDDEIDDDTLEDEDLEDDEFADLQDD